jgi:hypothetical protein
VRVDAALERAAITSLVADALSGDGAARLMVHAHNQQFVAMTLVVNPERPHATTAHDSTRAKARDWSLELPIRQPFDTPRDLCIKLRGGGEIAFSLDS